MGDKGLVIKSTGSWYTVHTPGGDIDCKVKGNFRLKGIRSTNPVAIGDWVDIERGRDDVAYITEIGDRRNFLVRKASNLSKQSHILASNVDEAMLVVTVARPETSLVFIDRFLAVAEAYRIPVCLVFNKMDDLSEDETRYVDMLINLYETVGYPCLRISARTDEGLDALRQRLKDKFTLLSGNSGVGKSTLINALLPEEDVKTKEISQIHETGQHTTTFSKMYPLPEGGWIGDIPGVKGFGTYDMEAEEIGHYFREIFSFSSGCRYGNCTHTHEPGCRVRQALDEHYIAQSRYQSYLSMLEDKDESKYRARGE